MVQRSQVINRLPGQTFHHEIFLAGVRRFEGREIGAKPRVVARNFAITDNDRKAEAAC